jgi:hypothetical protein
MYKNKEGITRRSKNRKKLKGKQKGKGFFLTGRKVAPKYCRSLLEGVWPGFRRLKTNVRMLGLEIQPKPLGPRYSQQNVPAVPSALVTEQT